MNPYRVRELKNFYCNELLTDIVPFWLSHGMDAEEGGFYTYLSRTGTPLSDDKRGESQGKAAWLFSILTGELEERKEWLQGAGSAVDFIREHFRRPGDGKLYAETSRAGKALRQKSSGKALCSAAMGMAAYSAVSGDHKALEEARELYALVLRSSEEQPDSSFEDYRHVKTLSHLCGFLNLCFVLRKYDTDNREHYEKQLDELVEELFRDFVKEEGRIILNRVSLSGEIQEGPNDHCINLALTFEIIWILMEEAERNNDHALMDRLLPLLDTALQLGWDSEEKGFYSFVDSRGCQPDRLDWDMKIWKVHCHGTYALLLAFYLTGNPLYETWFETVQEYTWEVFPDKKKKEWFGFLRRDGSVQMDLKGNSAKGTYHLPLFLLKTCFLLERMGSRG